MHGSLQLLKYVVMHLVAARAEFFRVGELECGVEGTPEKDPANETAQREKSQAQISAGRLMMRQNQTRESTAD